MRRLGALVGLCAMLAACQDAPTPPSESFQFPLAVFIQGKPNDFWDAVLSGMRTRLDLPGVQLETVFFTAAEREDIARRIVEGDWRTIAFCATTLGRNRPSSRRFRRARPWCLSAWTCRTRRAWAMWALTTTTRVGARAHGTPSACLQAKSLSWRGIPCRARCPSSGKAFGTGCYSTAACARALCRLATAEMRRL